MRATRRDKTGKGRTDSPSGHSNEIPQGDLPAWLRHLGRGLLEDDMFAVRGEEDVADVGSSLDIVGDHLSSSQQSAVLRQQRISHSCVNL
jgi:hypothetical protein